MELLTFIILMFTSLFIIFANGDSGKKDNSSSKEDDSFE